jgi:hypothetical protein
LGESVAVTATNNATQTRTVTVQLPDGVKSTRFTNLLGGSDVVVDNGRVTLTLPPLFGLVLLGQQNP